MAEETSEENQEPLMMRDFQGDYLDVASIPFLAKILDKQGHFFDHSNAMLSLYMCHVCVWIVMISKCLFGAMNCFLAFANLSCDFGVWSELDYGDRQQQNWI